VTDPPVTDPPARTDPPPDRVAPDRAAVTEPAGVAEPVRPEARRGSTRRSEPVGPPASAGPGRLRRTPPPADAPPAGDNGADREGAAGGPDSGSAAEIA